MKRTLALILTLTLLLSALPAQAVTFFPEGYTLHLDPFCVHRSFSLDSCTEKAVAFASYEAATDQGDYLPCSACYQSIPQENEPTAPLMWYYNPEGGSYLHRDPNCPSVSAKYLPLASQMPVNSPDFIPENACNICGTSAASFTHALDSAVWNASIEEKAELLPGVWTLPTENAISLEEAYAIARAEVRKYSDATEHCTMPMHYDHGWNVNDPRETWKVLVTTVLLKPICLVYIDALTGEVYSTTLSREYSNKMISPEQIQLTAASQAQLEIIRDNVNFREDPNGDVITRFDSGEVLTWVGEVRRGDELWYVAASPTYGEGYVSPTYAQPVHEGKLRGQNGSALTENLLAYTADLRRWQIENGFLSRSESGDSLVYTQDQSLVTDQARIDVVKLMLQHGIVVNCNEAPVFTDPKYDVDDQARIAASILSVHYGTSDLWYIFTAGGTPMPGIRPEDWHSPEIPTSEERRTLSDVLAAVEAEAR